MTATVTYSPASSSAVLFEGCRCHQATRCATCLAWGALHERLMVRRADAFEQAIAVRADLALLRPAQRRLVRELPSRRRPDIDAVVDAVLRRLRTMR